MFLKMDVNVILYVLVFRAVSSLQVSRIVFAFRNCFHATYSAYFIVLDLFTPNNVLWRVGLQIM
jgi:hypothetical protein